MFEKMTIFAENIERGYNSRIPEKRKKNIKFMFKRLLLSYGLLLAVVSVSATSVVEYRDTICWQQYYDFMGTRYELPDYWSHRDVSFMDVLLEYYN